MHGGVGGKQREGGGSNLASAHIHIMGREEKIVTKKNALIFSPTQNFLTKKKYSDFPSEQKNRDSKRSTLLAEKIVTKKRSALLAEVKLMPKKL